MQPTNARILRPLLLTTQTFPCADVSIVKKGAKLPEYAVQMPYIAADGTPVQSSAGVAKTPNVWYDEHGMPHYNDKK